MSFKATDETITITIPEIPYLSSRPLSLSLQTSATKTGLRLVVIVMTYLLFRPHLERLFKKMSGSDEPRSVQDLQGRMQTFEDRTGQPIGGGRKVAVATTSGSANLSGQGQTPKTRRKA